MAVINFKSNNWSGDPSRRDSAQYQIVEREKDGAPIWQVRRLRYGPYPTMPCMGLRNLEHAKRVIDWLVQHDAAVQFAVEELVNGKTQPLLSILQRAKEATTWDEMTTPSGSQ